MTLGTFRHSTIDSHRYAVSADGELGKLGARPGGRRGIERWVGHEGFRLDSPECAVKPGDLHLRHTAIRGVCHVGKERGGQPAGKTKVERDR